MTKAEYNAYVSRFKDGTSGLIHISTDGDEYFSWSPCHICHRDEGGNRENAMGVIVLTDEVIDIGGICPDCAYYLEYGQLDDMTMMEMVEG